MKNGVIFIGQELITNRAFIEYAIREIKKRVPLINSIYFLNEKNKDLFLDISSAYENFDALVVISSFGSYATAAKIIATIFGDSLVLKEDILIPSKSSSYTKNSFLIGEEKKINLIRAAACEKMEEPLLKIEMKKTHLYFIDLAKEEIEEILKQNAQKYDVSYFVTKECDELYKACIINNPYGNIEMFAQAVKNGYPDRVVIAPNIFDHIIQAFSMTGKTITFAESCTGGLLASMLTKIPGSSNIFKGSLVTYSNEMKTAWLGVREETLQTFGAVSEETVEEMLKGALRVAKADYAIAISGIAGPGGATPNKPVGTVVVGCMGKEGELIRTKLFRGDRNYIQHQAAMYGVKLLFNVAKEELF